MVERPAAQSDEETYTQSDDEADAASRIQSRKTLGRCKDLWAAVQDADEEEATFAIEAGADVNWKNPDEGYYTILMLASSLCSTPMVRLLLEHSADVNETSKLGNTALMAAVRTGSSRSCEVCALLLESGAEIDKQNLVSNNTALLIGK
jgi:ankyrin repeat protein